MSPKVRPDGVDLAGWKRKLDDDREVIREASKSMPVDNPQAMGGAAPGPGEYPRKKRLPGVPSPGHPAFVDLDEADDRQEKMEVDDSEMDVDFPLVSYSESSGHPDFIDDNGGQPAADPEEVYSQYFSAGDQPFAYVQSGASVDFDTFRGQPSVYGGQQLVPDMALRAYMGHNTYPLAGDMDGSAFGAQRGMLDTSHIRTGELAPNLHPSAFGGQGTMHQDFRLHAEQLDGSLHPSISGGAMAAGSQMNWYPHEMGEKGGVSSMPPSFTVSDQFGRGRIENPDKPASSDGGSTCFIDVHDP